MTEGQAFDFVIVGGGTAGAALAARLSEERGATVCLLEAGGTDIHPAIHIPGAVAAAIASKRLNWRFSTEPQPAMDNRRIPVPRGRVIGGSGAINGMVYFRGHPRDYDDWERAGAAGWNYRNVLPYFTRSEHNEDFPASVFHGKDGPVNIRAARRPNPLNHSFMDALAGLQMHHNPDFNGPDSEGYGLRQTMVRAGRRESTARSMLRPAMRRPNLTVLTRARAARILLEGRRAIGVALVDGREVRARREVILTAGAIQSPQLLLLSGIGPGAHLRAVGIEVAHDLPGVGGNLHDHVASPVHMETAVADSYGLSWKALPRGLWNLIEYAAARTGPLAANVFESVAFLKTDPAADRPDVQLVFQPARRLTTRLPLPIGHGYGLSPVALYPKSRGRLSLASSDPLAAPRIDPNLLSEPDDIMPLIRGVKLARSIFATAPFVRYRAHEALPGEAVQGDAAIAAHIRAHGYVVHHSCGTCRMGDDPSAVVDPALRVRGMEGLRVADASVFPSIIGGNTNAPTLMVAERAADLILGRPLLPAAVLPNDAAPKQAARP